MFLDFLDQLKYASEIFTSSSIEVDYTCILHFFLVYDGKSKKKINKFNFSFP